MKLHERVLPVAKIRNEIDLAVLNIIGKYNDLTHLEMISILNDLQATWIKYAIRQERHPDDPEKRGGEA